jgi:hypothetical protein
LGIGDWRLGKSAIRNPKSSVRLGKGYGERNARCSRNALASGASPRSGVKTSRCVARSDRTAPRQPICRRAPLSSVEGVAGTAHRGKAQSARLAPVLDARMIRRGSAGGLRVRSALSRAMGEGKFFLRNRVGSNEEATDYSISRLFLLGLFDRRVDRDVRVIVVIHHRHLSLNGENASPLLCRTH